MTEEMAKCNFSLLCRMMNMQTQRGLQFLQELQATLLTSASGKYQR